MPTITYGAIQTRVQTRLIDLPPAVLAEIPTLINDAVRFLTNSHNFKVQRAEADFTTVASTHVLGPVPADWKEPRENPYHVLNVGTTRELVWQPIRAYMYRKWPATDPNSIGPPRDLLLSEAESADFPTTPSPDQTGMASNIEVFPLSDNTSDWPDGQYRIKVPYWRVLPDLVNTGDTNWFTDFADRYLVDFATYQGFLLDWDEQRAGIWQQQAMGRFDGINYNTLGGWARSAINLDKSLLMAPGRTLTPRRDVMAQRDQFRT
jgi:hypothetical protein